MPTRGERVRRARGGGFTLVELLVVIAIIAVLIAILLPVVGGARRAALDVRCRSNMRQVSLALYTYAAENGGKFPPNCDYSIRLALPTRTNYWFDAERIGKYFPNHRVGRWHYPPYSLLYPNSVIGGVIACPADEGGTRSYAMNWWASSRVTNGWQNLRTIVAPDFPTAGKGFSVNAKQSSRLMLLIEAFSFYGDGQGGYMAEPTLGTPAWAEPHYSIPPYFYPGGWFLASLVRLDPDTAVPAGSFRHAPAQSRIHFSRHARRSDLDAPPNQGVFRWRGPAYTAARGRTNIAFADGHVASFTPDDLVNPLTGQSRFVALWTTLDPQVERTYPGPWVLP